MQKKNPRRDKPANISSKRDINPEESNKTVEFEFETVGGLLGKNTVYSINIFSSGRQRKSIIVDGEDENYPFQLIVFGPEKGMKEILAPQLTKREANQLKLLYAKQKQKGLKLMILAKKNITRSEYNYYTKEYEKISNSARDQFEDLERLASMMEVDLEFVGCFGLRDNIKEDAVALTEELKKSSLPISIFSGDELDNCLDVIQKLSICEVDIQKSSSFYGIRTSTSKGILLEMRRIFDGLHDVLQTECYLSMQRALKSDKEDARSMFMSSESKASLNNNKDQSGPIETLQDEKQETGQEQLTQIEQVNNLKKPLLISGDSIELIMESQILKHHLQAILLASSSIIAYNLRPKHKTFLTELMRKNGEVVLAVGDGFNDIGMLSCANIGIQISHKSVPIVFGDIVLHQLKQIPSLVYHHGFTFQKNLMMGFILLTNVVAFNMFFPIISIYFTNYTLAYTIDFNGYSTIANSAWLIALVLFTIMNPGYSNELMTHLPSLYAENDYFRRNMSKLFIIFISYAFIETIVLATVSLVFVANDLSWNGFPSSFDVCYEFYIFLVPCSIIFKFMIIANWRVLLPIGIVVTTVASIFLGLILIMLFLSHNAGLKNGSGGIPYLNTFLQGLIITLAFQIFFMMPIVYFSKYYIMNRGAAYFKTLRFMDSFEGTNDKIMKYLNTFVRFSDEPFLHFIQTLKRPFESIKIMDSSLRRIMNIDFHNSNLGLGLIANSILDEDCLKRFRKYQTRANNRKLIEFVIYAVVSYGIVEYLIVFFTKSHSSLALFDSIIPYFTLLPIAIYVINRFTTQYYLNRSIIGKRFTYEKVTS